MIDAPMPTDPGYSPPGGLDLAGRTPAPEFAAMIAPGPIDLAEAAAGDWRLYGSGISRTTTAVESLLVRESGDGTRVLEVHLPGGERRDFAMPAAVRRHLAALLLEDAATATALPAPLTRAAADVLAERSSGRDLEVCGTGGGPVRNVAAQILLASRAYLMRSIAGGYDTAPPQYWPWAAHWWNPLSFRRDLIRAGALIIAAIERLDHEAAAATSPATEAHHD